MALLKVSDTTVFRDESFYCGPGPSVVAFPDGEVLVFLRGHRAWNRAIWHMHYHPTTEQRIVRSADGGKTWGKARGFMAGGQCPCVTLLKDGTLLFVTHHWEVVPPAMQETIPQGPAFRQQPVPHVCLGTEAWRSTDRGESWDGPFWMDDVPGLEPLVEGGHAPVHIRGFAVELSDSTIAQPVYASGVGQVMMVSADGGKTWQYRGNVTRCTDECPLAYNEWVLCETPSGDLVGFLRCGLPPEQGGGFLHTSRSSDGGRTWTEPRWEKEVWGHPHFPLTMPSGRVLLAYGYRREPCGVRARLLEPECERPGEAEEVVLRGDGGGFDLGYPHATLLPDGRALVAYYINEGEDAPPYVAVTLVEED